MGMPRNVIRHSVESSLAGLFVLSTIGCQDNPAQTSQVEPPLPLEVRSIIAEQLHKAPEVLKADSTFAAVGADDLDFAEITMAVEDKLGIRIDDKELSKAAGTASDENFSHRLTLGAFAAVASSALKQPALKRKEQSTSNTNELNEGQVGSFGELSKKANPNRCVLVFVPDLETVVKLSEQQLGRTATQAERESLKAKAVVIALPPAAAERMKQERAKRQNQ